MNLTSDSFKENIKTINYIACELSNIIASGDVDTSKDVDYNAISLKCTTQMIVNILQSHGMKLMTKIKTVRSNPKREDIIMLKSMRMLAKSIEDLTMRNMDLVTMIDFDRVEYMQKLSLLIELIKELEVKYGSKYE